MKNNDKRFFWAALIIIFAALLIFYLMGQQKQSPYQLPLGYVNSSSCLSLGGEIINYDFNDTDPACPDGKQLLGKIYDLNCLCICCVPANTIPNIDPAVTETLKEQSRVPVIISARKQSGSGKIDIDRVLKTLGLGDFKLGSRWDNLWMFSGSLSSSGFNKLLMNPDVTSIQLYVPVSHGTCEDSDNGLNYYVRGLVNSCPCSGDRCLTCGLWVDECLDEITLIEYSCENLNGEQYNCPYGCRDGVCLNAMSSDMKFCQTDSDCVPATCCHPTDVVNKAHAPDCTGIVCTQECQPNTMDCGCGEPVCVNNQCEVAWTGNYAWCREHY